MLSSDETRSGGKPKERKGKPAQDRDKARVRKQKAAAQVPETDKAQNAPEEVVAPAVMTETATPFPSPADTSPAAPEVPAQNAPASYRAFADVWGNYSRTSLEQTKVYFEQLAGVRSIGAAFEVQAEFAKQACDTFVAESQRIGELQGELAKQRLKRFEDFMGKMMPGALSRR
jgi:hypothetical protein